MPNKMLAVLSSIERQFRKLSSFVSVLLHLLSRRCETACRQLNLGNSLVVASEGLFH